MQLTASLMFIQDMNSVAKCKLYVYDMNSVDEEKLNVHLRIKTWTMQPSTT